MSNAMNGISVVQCLPLIKFIFLHYFDGKEMRKYTILYFFTIIYAFQLCEGSRHMVPITLENDRSIALTLTYSLRLLYKHCTLCVDIVLEYITQ